jgi:hypothetical protein
VQWSSENPAIATVERLNQGTAEVKGMRRVPSRSAPASVARARAAPSPYATSRSIASC